MTNHKLFVINALYVAYEAGVVEAFHSEMFHGWAVRSDANLPWEAGCWYGDELKHPLHLIKNVHGLADVFMPHYIIVSEYVKDALSSFPGVTFFQVVFDKLFCFPCYEGDVSFYETIPEFRGGRYRSADDFVHRVDPCPPGMWDRVGKYYELIQARYESIVDEFQNRADMRDVSVQLTDRRRPLELKVCGAMLEKYPIIYHEDGAYLMSEAFFEALSPFLSMRYFDIKSATF